MTSHEKEPSSTHLPVVSRFHPGKGCIYSFDPVGSYEREVYRAGGSAASMLQPLLDNQVRMECSLVSNMPES